MHRHPQPRRFTMLRLLALCIPALLACTKDTPAPTAPAGKITAPAAPMNLRVEALTDTSATIAWDPVKGATDYDLNYRTLAGRWTNWPIRGATRAYATIHPLKPETEYRWAVRAEDRDGASRWVFAKNFVTLAQEEAPAPEPEPEPSIALGEPFNVELIFLDEFSQEKQRWMREVASQWEEFFIGVPDHTYEGGFYSYGYLANPYLPVQVRERQTTTIDDLRIYVLKVEPWELPPSAWSSSNVAGLASVIRERPDDARLPIISAIGIHEDFFVSNGFDTERWWKKTFHHELGHAFGLGASSGWDRYIEHPDIRTALFTGPNAVRQYRLMVDDPRARGVPLERIKGQPSIHWHDQSPMQWSLFTTYWLKRSNDSLPNISKVSLGAFDDIGWQVNYEKGIWLPPAGGLSVCDEIYICE